MECSGSALLATGQPRWLSAFVDMAHAGSAGVWLGGLLALTLAAPRVARTVARAERSAFSRELVVRFSTIALVSVAVLALTGFVRALFELNSVSQLWSTGYGRAIIIKSGLLALLIVIGWFNRYRLVPRLASHGEPEISRLRRNVRVEVIVLAGVVLAVAFLTDLRPGREVGPPRSARSVLRLNGSDRDGIHDVRHAATAAEVVHGFP